MRPGPARARRRLASGFSKPSPAATPPRAMSALADAAGADAFDAAADARDAASTPDAGVGDRAEPG
ncbi:hypothetical protein WJ63_01425 [Burkholderia pyrrocinia]|nr:hypothetical protein WJ63_01425 [Burkholderia pyrrocinia]